MLLLGSRPSGNFYKLTSELKVSNILKMGSGLIPKKSRILTSTRLQKFQTLFSLPVAFQSMKYSLYFIDCLPVLWLLVSSCTLFSYTTILLLDYGDPLQHLKAQSTLKVALF